MVTASSHNNAPVVHVVDDDPAILKMVAVLVTANGMDVSLHSSAEEFMANFEPEAPGCLVTDIRMPGMSGIELQELLARCKASIPVILMSGNPDVRSVVRGMKNNAIDVLEKPFSPSSLLERIRQALEIDAQQRDASAAHAEEERRMERLTSREREVAELVVAGHANKQVARMLDITEKTVEAHRGRLMKKLGLGNVVGLVRLFTSRKDRTTHN